jgi:GTP cyclohydrolase I
MDGTSAVTPAPRAALAGPTARRRPTRTEAEQAVRTLIEWAGDDPDREGLVDTPARVVRAYEEFFSGYTLDPDAVLGRTFAETGSYDDLVVLRDIRLESHCEHHLVPIIGRVHVAYLPADRVVGLSKLARLVDVYARRMQIQERLTVQIADAIDHALQPRGIAVVIQASHQCMTTRGVRKPGSVTVTRHLLGTCRTDPVLRRECLALLGYPERAPA